ncbi:MAG TPA: hypothetical protein VGC82_18090, partial [Rhodopila sp.]
SSGGKQVGGRHACQAGDRARCSLCVAGTCRGWALFGLYDNAKTLRTSSAARPPPSWRPLCRLAAAFKRFNKVVGGRAKHGHDTMINLRPRSPSVACDHQPAHTIMRRRR